VLSFTVFEQDFVRNQEIVGEIYRFVGELYRKAPLAKFDNIGRQRAEADALRQALAQCGSNLSQAAKLFGISRPTPTACCGSTVLRRAGNDAAHWSYTILMTHDARTIGLDKLASALLLMSVSGVEAALLGEVVHATGQEHSAGVFGR
jgi:hypothetical protein